MRIRNRIFWSGRQLAKALLILWSWEASADSLNGTWFLSVDNDSFAQTDDHYTTGLQIGWVSGYLEKYEDGALGKPY